MVGHLKTGDYPWKGRSGYGGRIADGMQVHLKEQKGYYCYKKRTKMTAKDAIKFSKDNAKLLDIAVMDGGYGSEYGHAAIFLGNGDKYGWVSDAYQGWNPIPSNKSNVICGIEFWRLSGCSETKKEEEK